MQSAILRVSTQEQGRSGLGLKAQRHEIEVFGEREGFAVRSWHKDVQAGAGADAQLLRPGLATALKQAKSARCPLIVSSGLAPVGDANAEVAERVVQLFDVRERAHGRMVGLAVGVDYTVLAR